MIRLHVVVEGQTEETFVNRILREPLAALGVYAYVRCVETSRTAVKVYRGGARKYSKIRNDLLRWMHQEQNNQEARFTTMIDLYRIPSDFPGRQNSKGLTDPAARVRALEEAFAIDIDHPRFVPYIQLHEFEALLLSDPAKFSGFCADPRFREPIGRLCNVVAQFPSPEMINDGMETSPSKRIGKEITSYVKQKPVAALRIAADIGLATMRDKCSRFDAWMRRLELLVGPSDREV